MAQKSYREEMEEIHATTDHIREQFLSELHELLKKYDAEITAEDHWTGYAECGSDIKMTVEFEDWKVQDIVIGTWIDKETYQDKKMRTCIKRNV